jgi:integrase
LKRALAERTTPQGSRSLVTGDTRLKDLVELWFAEVLAAAEAGDRSPDTPRTYRSHMDNQIIPALGELRVKEATAGRLDLAIDSIRKNKSPSVAKTCRSILSGVMGLAVRHGALKSNPMRDIRRITGSNAKGKARSLTIEECTTWLQRLEADPVAVRRDLPDLTRWFLATGVRMGEAIAVDWSNIDLDREQVDVDHKIIRVKGKGLVRVPRVKSSAGHRTLPMPLFAVEMLRRRLQTGPSTGPVFPDSIGG